MARPSASAQQWRTFNAACEMLAHATMLPPGPLQKKALNNLFDFLAKEREAAAIRAAKTEANNRYLSKKESARGTSA